MRIQGRLKTVLGFFDEFGFQIHCAAVDFAADVVVALLQAYAFDFGALFDDHRTAFDFQVFNQYHGVSVLQNRAVGIFDIQAFIGGRCFGFVPFVGAFGADILSAVFVGVFRLALRAGGNDMVCFLIVF